MRISTILGGLISFVAFAFIIVVIVKKLAFGDPVAGHPSIMAVILFLGGAQLLSIGVIGEYIGRIFNKTKHRPLYLVGEYHESKHESKKANK